jgi:hypothetical protein
VPSDQLHAGRKESREKITELRHQAAEAHLAEKFLLKNFGRCATLIGERLRLNSMRWGGRFFARYRGAQETSGVSTELLAQLQLKPKDFRPFPSNAITQF